jgi:AcrR family transcriptional regulator
MPPPPAARSKVLEAFATLLVTQGERAATLDAVAAEAGVSKGGLLYHFGSKAALAEGLMDLLRELTAADVETMRAAPGGPVDYFIRTSADSDSAFELVYVAVSRLAQGSYPQARAALDDAHEAWTGAVLEVVGDPVVTRAIMLIGDGLYAQASEHFASGAAPSSTTPGRDGSIDDLLALIDDLVSLRTRA